MRGTGGGRAVSAREWQRLAVVPTYAILFAALLAWAVVPDAVNYLIQGHPAVYSASDHTAQAEVASAIRQVLSAFCQTLAIAQIVLNLAVNGRIALKSPIAWVGAGWAVSVTAHVVQGGQPTQSMMTIGLVIVATLTVPAEAWSVAIPILGFFACGIAVVSLAMWVIDPEQASLAFTGSGRLTLFEGARLAGVASHPNALAYISTVGLAIALFGPWRRSTFLTVPLLLVTIAATGSRTGYLLVAMLLAFKLLGRRRKGIATIMGISIVVVAAISTLPFFVEFPVEWSEGRSTIWALVRSYWMDSPTWGHGPLIWQTTAGSLFPTFAFHAHNQVLDILFTCGLIGIGVYFATLLTLTKWSVVAAREGQLLLGILALVLVAGSISEVLIQYWLVDYRFLGWLTIAIVASKVKRDASLESTMSPALPNSEARGYTPGMKNLT